MKKTIVVSGAIAIALFAGLSSVPQVRSLVHSLVPSLGIEGGASASLTDAMPSASLGDAKAFQASNSQLTEQDLAGKLVDIDQPSSPATELASANQPLSESSDSHIVLAQSTEQPRTLNAVQTSPATDRFTKLSSFEQVPNEGVQVPSASANGILVDANATIIFVNDLSVPAQADGIITQLLVDEGSIVRKGESIYQLDPRLANAEIEVQSKELEQAKIKFEDKSNLEFSQSAHQVAIAEYQISNKLVAQGAEDEMTNRKKALEAEKARLQVVVSEMDKKKDESLVGVSEAKLEAAKVQLDIRSFVAPWDGIVSELKNRQSAYVRAGEPILQLTDMRKIRVKGTIDVSSGVQPHLLLNAPARVIIEIAPGAEESVDGIVGFVSPNAKVAHKYPYWIEIDNRLLPDGQYLFRGAMRARVEIQPRR